MRKIEAARPPQPPASTAQPAGCRYDALSPAGAFGDGRLGTAPPGAPSCRRSRWQPPSRRAEQRAYDAALDLFKRGDYGGGDQRVRQLRETYPRSLLASSAQYWIGNAQYARDYRRRSPRSAR